MFFKRIIQEKEKARADGHSDNRQTERTPHKYFRCESQDYLIAKYLNPPKENEKWRNQVVFNGKGNRACNNIENNSDQKIYAYMSRMCVNDECPSGNFGNISQLTNWILDNGETFHMTPEVSNFIPS